MNRTQTSIFVGVAALLLLGAGCAALRVQPKVVSSATTTVPNLVPISSSDWQHFYFSSFFGNGDSQLVDLQYPSDWQVRGTSVSDFTRETQGEIQQPGGPMVPKGKRIGVLMDWGEENTFGNKDQFSLELSTKNYNLQGEGYLPFYDGGMDIAQVCARKDATAEGFEFIDCVETPSGKVVIGYWEGWSAHFIVAYGNVQWQGFDALTSWLSTDVPVGSNSDLEKYVPVVKKILQSLVLK